MAANNQASNTQAVVGTASGRLLNAFNLAQISEKIHTGLEEKNGEALVSQGPINNRYRLSPFKANKNLLGRLPRFAVGKYNKEYPDYRRVTKADWRNYEFQEALVEAHQEGGGWDLLEKPLVCNSNLHVAEGVAVINGGLIAQVGFKGTWNDALHDKYSASILDYPRVVWTNTPPLLGSEWTVGEDLSNINPPCLFVRDAVSADAAPGNAASPGGGSRRSRRHKRRNYVKKQKKRTRKH